MRHFLIGALCLSLCFSSLNGVIAEEVSSEPLGIKNFNATPSGIRVYRPETWGLVNLGLKNIGSSEVNLLASTHFAGDQTLQFGRRFWIPPQSQLNTWHQILMPALATPDQKFFELRTHLMTTQGGVETLIKSDTGSMQFDQSFPVAEAKPITAAIFPLKMIDSTKSLWANPMDFLLTARYERGLTHNLSVLIDPMLPAAEEGLNAMDQFVIADDRILNDSAGISTIRQWVASGGSLWVMADQVSPALLEALLGDEDALTVVDRVGLTHVSMVKAFGTAESASFERDLDRPTPLVRVIAENIEPAFFVNGWPAAFWKSFGEGRILVTTLGADGWLRPRQPNDPVSTAGASFQTVFFGSEPLNYLATMFFAPRPQASFQPAVAEEQVRQTIGYTIPSRGIILGTLLGFTVLLGVCAAWLSRSGRLEWLGLATPLAAVIAAGILMSTGVNARSEISDTTSVVQLVQAVPGSSDIRVSSVAGVFAPGIFSPEQESTATLSGQNGGWMMPEMSGIEGVTRRLIWTDIDHWSWENIPQKPGLRTILSQVSTQSPLPLMAKAGFLATGLMGQIRIPEGLSPSDAILATSDGRIGLTIANDGQWTAENDSELRANQYLAANVLSDEQQRRSRVLADLLKPVPNRRVPSVPTLYVWTKPWNAGLSYGDKAPMTGSALVSIPVDWIPPGEGSEFTVPRSLLTYSEVTGPDGARPSGFYNFVEHEWRERTGATSNWIAFDLPSGILPLTTKSVEVTFKVKGAMGRLEISGFKDGKVHSIKTWDNPVGTLTHTVDDGTLLPLDQKGRFLIRIDAGLANPEAVTEQKPAPEATTPPPSDASESPAIAAPVLSTGNLTNYWQFEEISARITVVAPLPDAVPPATP